MIRASLAAAALAALFFSAPLTAQTLRYDVRAGPEVILFESGGLSEQVVAARASGGLVLGVRASERLTLTVQPRAGLRVFALDTLTSTEVVADVATSLSSAAGGRLRWQVYVQGKLRDLSDPPALPVYLEPGRAEGWAGAVVSAAVGGGWALEARGSAGLVRYTPDEWEVLDRNLALGSLGLAHAVGPGIARLSLALGGDGYIAALGPTERERDDTRWSLRLDWGMRGAIVLQLESGFAWSSSNYEGFDYRSRRFGLLLSTSLGSGSAQLYAAYAAKTYTELGPPDARVAPSDRDTGSFVVVQTTHPLGESISVHVRGEWSRSETGFRDQYFQRLGLSVLLSLR
ncbi:MAG: hypothetical protein AMS25_01470 [Gemmatimonas sp. SM23_52]|nr:MAG: hypothetical protein AMS25_01470 [Gemmatimonas sp. SM23_52]